MRTHTLVVGGVVAVAGLTAAAFGVAAPALHPAAAPAAHRSMETSPTGDIPDNQAFVTYTPPGGGFSVKVPEGWGQKSVGKAVVFTDKLNAIRLDSAQSPGPVTVAAARRRVVPVLRRTVPGFQLSGVSLVTRHAGTAVLITYRATSAKDPVTGKTRTDSVERYAFHHGRRGVTVTLSGPVGADNVDPWRIVTDSVRWTR